MQNSKTCIAGQLAAAITGILGFPCIDHLLEVLHWACSFQSMVSHQSTAKLCLRCSELSKKSVQRKSAPLNAVTK
jgi:hypothetical protein